MEQLHFGIYELGQLCYNIIITAWNGHTFGITGPLCRESIDYEGRLKEL